MSTSTYYNNKVTFIRASTANSDALDALWLPRNQKAAKFWGVAVASLIGLVTILHWTAFLIGKFSSGQRLLKRFLRISRRLNSLKLGNHAPVPGYALVMILYLGINLTMVLYDRPYDSGVLTTFAQRMGWITLCNLCTTVFLSLKNTPLFPLTGRSFDEINVLHRCAGYTTIGCMLIHSICYLDGLTQINQFTYTMGFTRNHWAGAAGISLLLILCTATGVVRRRYYELFYVVHVVFVGVVLISVGCHRNEVAEGELVITLLTASLWFVDKSVRWIRWVASGYGNHCTIEALPGEATKVTMRRPIKALPGSMARLYIPSIRPSQRHPFSLVSQNPATFIVKARNGFTRDLYNAALSNPKDNLKASIEGPYGGFSDLSGYDKIIVIAGGSGITFSTSLATAWSQEDSRIRSSLDLIWSIREEDCITWLDKQLPILSSDCRIKISIYISGAKDNSGEKYVNGSNSHSTDIDAEECERKSHSTNLSPPSGVSIRRGRPDINYVLGEGCQRLKSTDRVLVTGCGPQLLGRSIRECVANSPSLSSLSIKVHIEEFSY